ncbi:MAG: hypothetical protein JWQ43_694 [Glaciihabitans sp.]|nr:hypothetical protein [Glaciihabitans sp.]
MRQPPSHTVNRDLVLDVAAVPEGLGVNVEAAAHNVHTMHGADAAARYRHFFGAATSAVLTGPVQHALLLSLGAIAAWRAGTIELRTDALRRLDIHLAEPVPPLAALAAALGLDPDEVAPFCALQQGSRFGWPLFAEGENTVATLGGFAGLDGPWIAPPTGVTADAEPGVFHVVAGAENWRLECDLFGSVLTPLGSDPAGPPDSASTSTSSTFSMEALGPVEDGSIRARLSTSEFDYVATLSVTVPPAAGSVL